ncbi:hypothetical protein C7M84_018767 [Penaeus vannamei]|uniref:SKA complex subunit 1 n=1 Tax=Penaeus vannamei TaxID=6689 RepID=A0A3R7LUJ1_PENVA|nr:hypothetical protein C7M84_018767 [Penaeus vannamei]
MTAVGTALTLEALEEGFPKQDCCFTEYLPFSSFPTLLPISSSNFVSFLSHFLSLPSPALSPIHTHPLYAVDMFRSSWRLEGGHGLPEHVVADSDKKNKASQEKQAPKKDSGKSSQTPTISYVTVKEFNDVPKYIRGRLQYDQINLAVDEVNKTLETKYALLRRPRAKLSDVDMKVAMGCRQQENQETKGLYFVVDNDIKRWSSLKLDSNGRSIMTALRTLKRIREVRGPGNLVRYAVLL